MDDSMDDSMNDPTVTGPSAPSGRVLAVCVGRAATLTSGSRSIRTAFVKQAVAGPVLLGPLGFPGDEHVYRDHGGPDMAVLVYSADHRPFWETHGLDLPTVGAMGENLTVTGLTETEVHLGDVFRVGQAVVQVAQPRSPCSKIGARYGDRRLPVVMQDTGRTGYLLRVLTPGEVAAGDEMVLTSRVSDVSVAEAGRVLNVDRGDLVGARRVLAVAELGASSRRTLEARVDAPPEPGLDTARLFD